MQKSILIVEDNELNMKLFNDLLEAHGYKTVQTRSGIEAVAKFFEEVGVQRLPLYADGSGKALRALRAFGLPTSLIIDREGREVGSVTGPAEWDSGATIEFLRGVISQR